MRVKILLIFASILISPALSADDAKDLADMIRGNIGSATDIGKNFGDQLVECGSISSLNGENTSEVGCLGITKNPDTADLENLASDPESLEAAGQAMLGDPTLIGLGTDEFFICYVPDSKLQAYNSALGYDTKDGVYPICTDELIQSKDSCELMATKPSGKTVEITDSAAALTSVGIDIGTCENHLDQKISGYYQKKIRHIGSSKICYESDDMGNTPCTGDLNTEHVDYSEIAVDEDAVIINSPYCTVSYTRQHYRTSFGFFVDTNWNEPISEHVKSWLSQYMQNGEVNYKTTTIHNSYENIATIRCTDLPVTDNAYAELKAKSGVTITSDSTGLYDCLLTTGNYRYYNCGDKNEYDTQKTITCSENPREGLTDYPELCSTALSKESGCYLENSNEITSIVRKSVTAEQAASGDYANCTSTNWTTFSASYRSNSYYVFRPDCGITGCMFVTDPVEDLILGSRFLMALRAAANAGYGTFTVQKIPVGHANADHVYFYATLTQVPRDWTGEQIKFVFGSPITTIELFASDILNGPISNLVTFGDTHTCDVSEYEYLEKIYQCVSTFDVSSDDINITVPSVDLSSSYCVVEKINADTGKTDRYNKSCISNECPLESGENIEVGCSTVDRTAEDFGRATSQLSIADSVGNRTSDAANECNNSPDCITDKLRLFPGVSSKCRYWRLNQVPQTNCCESAWDFCKKIGDQYVCYDVCTTEDALCQDMREEGSSVHVGSYTNDDCCCSGTPLKYCWDTERYNTYCIFDNPLAKLLQVAGRAQLAISWGTDRTPDCRGFTIDEFDQIDFGKVDFTPFMKELGLDEEGVLDAIKEYMKGQR